ncbi:phage gp45-like [Thalassospira sp. MBR-102]|jgi:phage gp45-like|uniref:hypothetical protein n=1 Tax=Thalassospira sp. MBR-102 TaxID=3156466 RepID=UPI0033940756
MSDGLFQRLSRRVENMIFRAVVRYAKSTSQGGAISAQLAGRSGDTLDGVVVFEGYGFSHIPLPVDANGRGAETIVFQLERNLAVAIPPMDRRHRAKSGAVIPGEVSIYDDQGQRITLKRGKKIVIDGADFLDALIATKVLVNCPDVEFTGNVKIGGNLEVVGQATVGGDITDQAGSGNTRTVAGMREVYNGHEHPENDNNGPTDPPNQGM